MERLRGLRDVYVIGLNRLIRLVSEKGLRPPDWADGMISDYRVVAEEEWGVVVKVKFMPLKLGKWGFYTSFNFWRPIYIGREHLLEEELENERRIVKELWRRNRGILYLGLLDCDYIVFLGEKTYVASERISLSPKYDPIVIDFRALPVPTGG